ncbi:MAG: Mur ligase [Bacteroidetes bacterium CG12_big_fil_rev_8_21_14_0_65_60_17]|nr:MAG: Mur ligase [Bacteroidetes bacterium CG12_big_fil_rev_8_21_14_0_65_60_17]
MTTAWHTTLLLAAAGTLATAFAVWRAGRRQVFFLHMAQLEGYKVAPFAAWVTGRMFDVVLRWSHAVGTLLLVILVVLKPTGPALAGLFSAWAVAFMSSRRYRRDRPKKALAWTPRMKRLAVTSVLVTLLVSTFVAAALSSHPPLALLAFLLAADLLAPVAVATALAVNVPLERRVHQGFIRQAQTRLAHRPDLGIVAITGSYGKTSTKFAIREMLSQRHPVLASPGSFNTPMGICRVVNNMLEDDHRWLVLEMGTRHSGDITALCEIARPDIAVVTSVGKAHLATMGSVEAIAREKGSLLRFLPRGGTAILNWDDKHVASMRAEEDVHYIYVSAAGHEEADIRAENVRYDACGCAFDVVFRRDRVRIETRLLGAHNITNMLLALAVGHASGLTLRQMAPAFRRLQPVPHRLELRHDPGGLTVLDDAFNSNPVGARSAVDVLSHFTSGQRIVITPGMVELGAVEEEENRAWGAYMALRVDTVVLVGADRTRPIAEGLRRAGFPDEGIVTVRTLFDARAWLTRNAKPGDTVLYENDLPDQYTEAS